MLQAGEDPAWSARMLGHTTTRMLYERYGKFIKNRTRQDGSAYIEVLKRGGNQHDGNHPNRHDGRGVDRGIEGSPTLSGEAGKDHDRGSNRRTKIEREEILVSLKCPPQEKRVTPVRRNPPNLLGGASLTRIELCAWRRRLR
jgi:hypothetical protein